MSQFEVVITILDEKYTDQLIVALVRQGYAVYFNNEEKHQKVCFTTTEEEVTETNHKT